VNPDLQLAWGLEVGCAFIAHLVAEGTARNRAVVARLAAGGVRDGRGRAIRSGRQVRNECAHYSCSRIGGWRGAELRQGAPRFGVAGT